MRVTIINQQKELSAKKQNKIKVLLIENNEIFKQNLAIYRLIYLLIKENNSLNN